MSRLETLFRKLQLRDALSAAECAALTAAAGPEEVFHYGQTIVPERETQTVSRLLVDGMAARAKSLSNGARQITALHIAGDFMDLHSFLLKRLDHHVVALSRVRVINVPHAALKRISEEQPHLSRLLWLTTLLDAAIHREWLVSAGRRSAAQQIGHLFCELAIRYEVVGLSDGRRYALPISQDQLADVTGLSTVHVNRVVQGLRREGLVDWRGGELTIHDFQRLAEASLFDPGYLVLDREPR